MSSSLVDEEQNIKLASFISFSKTVMKNICRNVKAKMNRDKRKDDKLKEVLKNVSDLCDRNEIYSDEFVITDAHGHSGVITMEWLYKAMLNLNESQKEVLILRYWHGMSGRDIAKSQNVSERTVYTRKQKAFKNIKDFYERTKKNGN